MANIVKMENICKVFGSSMANDHVNLAIEKGEIHALLGENGAGKTTLMNILYGLYKPTSGKIYLEDKEVVIDSPLKAIQLGIGMVHQHFMLVPAMSTWENVVLGLKSNRFIFFDKKESRAKIQELAAQYHLQIDLDMPVSQLSVGLQQQVEILKMLYRGSRLLIMDEPTGVLTPLEKEELFKSLKGFTKQGISVIFISHKLDEIKEISDRVSILNRGKNVSTVQTADVTTKDLAKLMVGRDVVFTVKKSDNIVPGNPVLELKNVNAKGVRLASSLKDLNFKVCQREIVGIAGVDGNGQSELMEVISGLRKIQDGNILLNDKDIANKSPLEILRQKTSLIPEDRKTTGTVKDFDIDKNLILRDPSNNDFTKNGIINYKMLKEYANKTIEEYDIRLTNRGVPVSLLSGGNIQKVVLAREINRAPDLLLAMHPTRGLDVGAIEFIHSKLLQAKEAGAGIILVSTELEEILSLSDRILVMCSGVITGELSQENATIEKIGELMGGNVMDEEVLADEA